MARWANTGYGNGKAWIQIPCKARPESTTLWMWALLQWAGSPGPTSSQTTAWQMQQQAEEAYPKQESQHFRMFSGIHRHEE